MSADLQAKLLRVLEESAILPVSGERSTKVNVRVLAATHRNLERLTVQGGFRQDLFYRLNVLQIHVPATAAGTPLRTLSLFAEHFLAQASDPPETLSEGARRELQTFFVGNRNATQRLKNVVERASVLARCSRIEASDNWGSTRTRQLHRKKSTPPSALSSLRRSDDSQSSCSRPTAIGRKLHVGSASEGSRFTEELRQYSLGFLLEVSCPLRGHPPSFQRPHPSHAATCLRHIRPVVPRLRPLRSLSLYMTYIEGGHESCLLRARGRAMPSGLVRCSRRGSGAREARTDCACSDLREASSHRRKVIRSDCWSTHSAKWTGLLLGNETIVTFPAHMGDELASVVKPGDAVVVKGYPESPSQIKGYVITSTASNQTVVDAARSRAMA